MTDSTTINADIEIIHEDGSGIEENVARIEDEFVNGRRNLRVWYNTYEGEPDHIYENASISSITA